MATLAAVYLNQDGSHNKTIIPSDDEPDNYDFTGHDEPGLTCFIIDKTSLSPPMNLNGVAFYYDLSQTILAQAAQRGTVDGGGPTIYDAISARVAEADAYLAAQVAASAELAAP